jgi:hypothetical protein
MKLHVSYTINYKKYKDAKNDFMKYVSYGNLNENEMYNVVITQNDTKE